jgi:hypothetical protein
MWRVEIDEPWIVPVLQQLCTRALRIAAGLRYR